MNTTTKTVVMMFAMTTAGAMVAIDAASVPDMTRKDWFYEYRRFFHPHDFPSNPKHEPVFREEAEKLAARYVACVTAGLTCTMRRMDANRVLYYGDPVGVYLPSLPYSDTPEMIADVLKHAAGKLSGMAADLAPEGRTVHALQPAAAQTAIGFVRPV